MEITAEKLSRSMDEMLDGMDFVFSYILSDSEILDAIATLSVEQNSKFEEIYFSEAANTIRSKLTIDFILKNYYRVIVFNDNGSIIAGSNLYSDSIDYNTDISDFTWYSEIRDTKGKSVIVGAHIDSWNNNSKTEVISLIKEVQGNTNGYIEIQKVISDLERVLQLADLGLEIMIISDEQEVLYANLPEETHYFYINNSNIMPGINELVNDTLGKKEIVACANSSEWGFNILLIQKVEEIDKSLEFIMSSTLLITFVFFTISVICVIVIASYLTIPLNRLIKAMNETDVENIEEEIYSDGSNVDEIMKLYKAYIDLLKRLNNSIKNEKQLSYLQLRAQFDLLQAQVNPHFIYNTLNVISAKGVIHDIEICNICNSLGKMLRYSTNTKIRYASISEELEYLEEYFYLLKSRYRHRLLYSIEVDDKLKHQLVPKISIQQLVENSISHGYDNIGGTMKIEIYGWTDCDRWYLKIKDNGEGFKQKKLEEIYAQLDNVRRCLLGNLEGLEMQIGGMGLLNTYARLLLVYGEDITFEIYNSENGAEVIIGAEMNGREPYV